MKKSPGRQQNSAITAGPGPKARGGGSGVGRGERTREKIRDVANQLFLELGFDGTTVDAIVEAAGVSKGTFYIYFKRKEDLLLEYGWRRLEHLANLVPSMMVEDLFECALRRLVETVMRNKNWSREVTRRTIAEVINNAELLQAAPHRLLQPLVEVGQARGQVRADISADILAQFILRTLLGSLYDWGEPSNPYSADECLDKALSLTLAALSPSTVR